MSSSFFDLLLPPSQHFQRVNRICTPQGKVVLGIANVQLTGLQAANFLRRLHNPQSTFANGYPMTQCKLVEHGFLRTQGAMENGEFLQICCRGTGLDCFAPGTARGNRPAI